MRHQMQNICFLITVEVVLGLPLKNSGQVIKGLHLQTPKTLPGGEHTKVRGLEITFHKGSLKALLPLSVGISSCLGSMSRQEVSS